MIGRLVDRALAGVEYLLALALLAMLVMVFGNVVLRYALNTGITVSEEICRFLFVWITFLGAVVVLRRGGHLGFDLLVSVLPAAAARSCRIVSDLLMLACCLVFLAGAWTQTMLNLGNQAPVTGLPLGWVYAAAVAGAGGLGLLILADLVAAVAGRGPVARQTPADPGA